MLLCYKLQIVSLICV
uniref:Uncharacterized protein n=1 Tax=Anguilla anguilla TaxID=7936 RepID=A0A0E9P5H5_ANGAN